MIATPKSPGKTETAKRRKAKLGKALRTNLQKRRQKQKQSGTDGTPASRPSVKS